MTRTIIVTSAAAALLVLAGCGQQQDVDPSGPPAVGATLAEAAATVALGDDTAIRPIPREGLPAFVETAPGGSYLTSMSGDNDRRAAGTLIYAAPGPVEDVVAFHRNSLERMGMAPTPAISQNVRDTVETSFEGRSADGRSSLTVVVIDKSEPTVPVQLNFSSEKP